MVEIKPFWQNYINGEWVDGGAGRLTVDNPATGEALAEQAMANAADVDRAVAAAKAVHDSGVLMAMRPGDRGRMVRKMGDYLLDNLEEIATVLTLDAGKPLWEAKGEVTNSARYFEYYGSQADTLEGKSIPLGDGYMDFTVNEPYGVSAQIIPWNFPLEIASRSVACALTTGNACVVKSSEIDPLVSSYLARAAEAVGFPAGSVNILCGLGSEAGAALAGHPDINQMVFTGSVATGVTIAKTVADAVVPSVLELGGKSAAIVHQDADVANLLASVRKGIFFNAGQVCSAMSRLVVHEKLHDEVVEGAANLASSLSVGPGIERTEFGANMGAMVSEKQRDRAEGLCRAAEQEGARAVAGGRKLNNAGYFLEPTVFDSVDPSMTIAQEEVFGPVLSVIRFGSDEEALQIANGTQYGLVGGVFTEDLDRAMRTARGIKSGQVFVNEWFAGGVETPFGGYGKSGYGREKGREALWNYVQTKNIAIAMNRQG